ncbi:nucleoside deaminase [Sphingobium indicum]|jgi:guanine deaminase|uniref:Nucleoside deaminase n=2 Tax=Sphingomonadaceae TaxID=41297 RepID=A0A4Q4IW55_9SPHN|nr:MULTISPECIES: nucleoside deaminase [Sphingomonadaceae]EJU12724.1 guanine deaminase [Sphingomonas sp. LH128]NYI24774.1 tRNA(Arg) A34 adenosine deaminase TadA [Sphingobium indicum]RYL97828.1 nucleoside deaminase [Sphingobium indicum]BBF72570.1 guanine deaminase [Sphingomonas bisphenolicum]
MLTNSLDDEFMRRAISLSQQAMATGSGPPFGAVIVRGGGIVAEGLNCVHANHDPTAHAEIVAIRKACERLSSPFLEDCVIYSSSEPCPMCLSAIHWSRISAIYFATDREAAALAGFDDALLYAELQRPVALRQIPMVQVLPGEGQRTFDLWAENGHVAMQTRLEKNGRSEKPAPQRC